jgi:hypothetical protein
LFRHPQGENNFKNTVNDNWNEAVTPWKAVVSHPSYYPHQVSLVIKRKQKPVDSRVPDWQRTNLVDGETKQTVRCVNDELEHGSYLYVPVIVHCVFKIIFSLMFTIFADPSQGIC